MNLYDDSFERGLSEGRAGGAMHQKEMDASMVEASECVCLYLVDLDEIGDYDVTKHNYYSVLSSLTACIGVDYCTDPPTVTKHAPCCCKYLAEKIRS
jgi:hypothetical protein